jgi:hypothetical protein
VEMYALVPITNRRIALGSASVVAIGLTLYAINGAAAFLILGFMGLASAPLLLLCRSWFVSRMMRDCQGVQS